MNVSKDEMDPLSTALPAQTRGRLGIRGRLFAGFVTISFIILAAFGIVFIKTSLVEAFTANVIETQLPSHEASYDLAVKLYTANEALNAWIITRDPAYKKYFSAAWESIENLQTQVDNFSRGWNNAKHYDSWQRVKVLLDRLKTAQENIFNQTDFQKMRAILTSEISPLTGKIHDNLDGALNADQDRVGGLFDLQYQQLQHSTREIVNGMNAIKIIEFTMLVTVFFLSLAIAWLTANKIIPPLNNAIDIAKKIARGERNLSISTHSRDETGVLLSALDQMQKSIRDSETRLKESEARSRELSGEIVKKANLFSQHSAKVAAGDLRQRISNETNDEMGRLGKDLNTMTENLASMTQQITEACHNMVTTLDEVKHAVDIQSSGASEQASSIQQITASLEEIEKSSNQTIEKAKALGEAAGRTREKGQMGLEAVEQSVLGMRGVKEKVQIIAQTILDLSNKTQQVGEITAVVNGLAQQSKMLALNASIEAAKAGEAGKGFAVVASEVKTLAEQSEQSTAQVQKILEDIRHATEKAVMATEEGTKGVDYGTTLVEQTGDVVRSLSEVISETTVASQQIEAAVRQESVGIEQITAGMNEINQVTSEFVESVKQTTEALGDLASISHNLKEHVDVYKT